VKATVKGAALSAGQRSALVPATDHWISGWLGKSFIQQQQPNDDECGKVIAEPKELIRIVKGTSFQEALRYILLKLKICGQRMSWRGFRND
jgi:hypothetical protein